MNDSYIEYRALAWRKAIWQWCINVLQGQARMSDIKADEVFVADASIPGEVVGQVLDEMEQTVLRLTGDMQQYRMNKQKDVSVGAAPEKRKRGRPRKGG